MMRIINTTDAFSRLPMPYYVHATKVRAKPRAWVQAGAAGGLGWDKCSAGMARAATRSCGSDPGLNVEVVNFMDRGRSCWVVSVWFIGHGKWGCSCPGRTMRAPVCMCTCWHTHAPTYNLMTCSARCEPPPFHAPQNPVNPYALRFTESAPLFRHGLGNTEFGLGTTPQSGSATYSPTRFACFPPDRSHIPTTAVHFYL